MSSSSLTIPNLLVVSTFVCMIVSLSGDECLADNASIIINNDRGVYNANGDIHVGPPSFGGTWEVVFDGNIMITDDTRDGGGRLLGDITINGCHETPDDLDICICGSGMSNTPTINQDDCEKQVDYSCVTGCP